jgi:plasmid stability protein
MGSIVIRNLDDAIIDSFRTKAELNGRSLEAEMRDALRQTAPLSREQKCRMLEKVRITLPAGSPDSTDLIREDRDSR